jgi:hypothetical protein
MVDDGPAIVPDSRLGRSTSFVRRHLDVAQLVVEVESI